MPSLRVEMFEGRTPQQKRDLARELTDACVRVLGGSPEAVDIVFYDVPRHDWSTGGVLWISKVMIVITVPPCPSLAVMTTG